MFKDRRRKVFILCNYFLEIMDYAKQIIKLRRLISKGLYDTFIIDSRNFLEEIMVKEYEKHLERVKDKNEHSKLLEIKTSEEKKIAPKKMSLGRWIGIFRETKIFQQIEGKYFNVEILNKINKIRNDREHDGLKLKKENALYVYVCLVNGLIELGYDISSKIHKICRFCNKNVCAKEYGKRYKFFLCNDCYIKLKGIDRYIKSLNDKIHILIFDIRYNYYSDSECLKIYEIKEAMSKRLKDKLIEEKKMNFYGKNSKQKQIFLSLFQLIRRNYKTSAVEELYEDKVISGLAEIKKFEDCQQKLEGEILDLDFLEGEKTVPGSIETLFFPIRENGPKLISMYDYDNELIESYLKKFGRKEIAIIFNAMLGLLTILYNYLKIKNELTEEMEICGYNASDIENLLKIFKVEID